MKNMHEDLEAIREIFPHVVEEFERLRLWVMTCLGEHVAMPGGPTVEDPGSVHAQAAAELAHLKGDEVGAKTQREAAEQLARHEALSKV